MAFLSTPSARRATAPGCSDRWRYPHFYPRPPRGGRRSWIWTSRPTQAFLSTPSARRATGLPAGLLAGPGISIHALREEGDRFLGRLFGCRGRFLSTPSARRATSKVLLSLRQLGISIHALREEGDRSHKRYPCPEQNFYPRPPRGGRRRLPLRHKGEQIYFYPRPPRGGRPRASF